MAENSAIEWTDHTFNPWEGCQKVGPGCDHCYAEARNARYAPKGAATAPNWGPHAPRRRTSAANWSKPLRWQRDAAAFITIHGRRQRVFCASLADVFDNHSTVLPEWRADLFDLIRATPDLDWLLLTKRIGNAAAMALACGGLPANVWLGATIVNQDEADRDIPKLLAIDARVRFLSMEPLLGAVDLTSIKAPREPDEPDLDTDWRFDALEVGDYYWCNHPDPDQCGDSGDGPYRNNRIDWVIVGGESGTDARPLDVNWARELRDQCANATLHGDPTPVPFLFKQWGGWLPAGQVAALTGPWEPLCGSPLRTTKANAGRLLDNVQHDGVPA